MVWVNVYMLQVVVYGCGALGAFESFPPAATERARALTRAVKAIEVFILRLVKPERLKLGIVVVGGGLSLETKAGR